jgi:hercynine metabolism small protein
MTMNQQTIYKPLVSTEQLLRFEFYRELENIYHHFFDQIAQSKLTERAMAELLQLLMRSRQASLNQLISTEEFNTYFAADSDDN